MKESRFISYMQYIKSCFLRGETGISSNSFRRFIFGFFKKTIVLESEYSSNEYIIYFKFNR